MKLLVIFLYFIKVISGTPTPIVLWHGMGDTCCLSISLGTFKIFLEETIPGVYVNSLRIGNSSIEDLENGYFMNPNKQIQLVCKMLAEDPKLKDGFNAIGFSQGSQFLRAVVQRCGHKLPPIKNLISLGGQHQGVYGLPHCGVLMHPTCDYVRQLLNYAAYENWVQYSLVQATYWHDPLDEESYKHKSIFLSDINNEVYINKTYIENLNKLEHFILVMFNNDTIVQPRETEWFGFYEPGQSTKMLTLQESKLYLEDRIGLNKMDKAGKLIFLSVDGDHLRFSDKWFIKNLITPYLKRRFYVRIQYSLVQATYWHDPLDEESYKHKSIFLSDINNEVYINKTYIENLNKLEHFILVMFNNDTIVQPRETEWFGFYEPGQSTKMLTLQESKLYLEDRIGLNKMDKAGKLIFLSVDGDHLRFSDKWFIKNLITPYLK